MHLREAPKKEMTIPQSRFLLRDPNGKKPTSIYCQLRFNNDRIVFATGEKTVAVAIMDRLVHDANRIELTGESMRKTRKKRQDNQWKNQNRN